MHRQIPPRVTYVTKQPYLINKMALPSSALRRNDSCRFHDLSIAGTNRKAKSMLRGFHGTETGNLVILLRLADFYREEQEGFGVRR